MTDRNIELFVSLGHNSSACVTVDGVLVAGYEQERLDRVKSSSAFPRDAIVRCMEAVRTRHVDRVHVGHWFDDWRLSDNRYLDLDFLKEACPIEAVSHNPDLTHHDAHARSALDFARSHGQYGHSIVVVMDGFGNRQECVSIYRIDANSPCASNCFRIYGYENSLGLMYQYATSFVGLKMHQDEYKLLGYEAHILEHFELDRVSTLGDAIDRRAREFMLTAMNVGETPGRNHPPDLINIDALRSTQGVWEYRFRSWLRNFDAESASIGVKRSVVAFCAQRFIESATMALLNETVLKLPGFQNCLLILTGGCFYNVKLNRLVQRYTGMRTMAHPWAGDQGAALGLSSNPVCVTTPYIGHREIETEVARLCHVPRESWVDKAAQMLADDRIVSVVRGAMEYGPRALCHTTTFALPTRENVARINALNERDESMPMAPVLTRRAAVSLFSAEDMEGVAVSDGYMVTTCRFAGGRPRDGLMGVAHRDPLCDTVWTARPQLTSDPEVVELLQRFPDECLINTSFNYHGEPIVESWTYAARTWSMQCLRSQLCGFKIPELLLVVP